VLGHLRDDTNKTVDLDPSPSQLVVCKVVGREHRGRQRINDCVGISVWNNLTVRDPGCRRLNLRRRLRQHLGHQGHLFARERQPFELIRIGDRSLAWASVPECTPK
jgi:hypothetical protein